MHALQAAHTRLTLIDAHTNHSNYGFGLPFSVIRCILEEDQKSDKGATPMFDRHRSKAI
jgi:hypothetical protein